MFVINLICDKHPLRKKGRATEYSVWGFYNIRIMDKYFLNKKKITCADTKEICYGYKEYLLSEHWKNFRLSVINSRKKCECCGKTYEIMNVHHISYKSLGKEKSKDVALLCEDCHKYIHAIKSGRAICSSERILRMVKKPKHTKNKAKKSQRVCDNCIFFTRSKEGNKSYPLCTKTMIYYPKAQIEYNCRNFKSKYDK